MFRRWRPLAFSLAYTILAYLCLAFTRFGLPVEALWLANALLAAALVSLPKTKWVQAIILAAGGNGIAHIAIGDTLAASISYMLADIGEATLFAWLYLKAVAAPTTRIQVLAIAGSSLISPLLSTVLLAGLASLMQIPLSLYDLIIWFAVDTLGYLIFFPLFRGFHATRWLKIRVQPWLFVALIFCVFLLGVTGAMTQSPLPRLIFLPLIVGITVTFGIAGSLAGLGTLLVTWVVFTVNGYAPAGWPGIADIDPRALLLLVQAFVAAVAFTVIPLAIFMEEREANALKMAADAARFEAEKARVLSEANASLEQKVVERTEELGLALIRAESADRTKSMFLATMSHELRTPLNSILGFSGIVAQGMAGPVNEEQTKQLGMVRASARHLLDLINDVLDISKIEAGELDVHLATFDVVKSLRKVVDLMAPAANAKSLSLELVCEPSEVQVISDRRRFEQVMLNLVNNAVKFTHAGGVKITVEPENGATPFVHIRVKDSGVGIRPEDLESLFQPFRQIRDGISDTHEGGTGLGLAICKRLAELMGAQIDVQSEWGQGSIFTLTLPVRP